MGARHGGVVSSWGESRGYGWVRGEDRQLYFVHVSAVDRAQHDKLAPGVRCTFMPSKTPKGPRAEDVALEW